jgi:hypothetical protein
VALLYLSLVVWSIGPSASQIPTLFDYDIPQDGLLANLMVFNAGVELGQLLDLAATLIVMGYWHPRCMNSVGFAIRISAANHRHSAPTPSPRTFQVG